MASTSAKKYSVRAEWLRQSGRAPSEPAEKPRWRIIPRPASIQRVAFYITLRSLFHCLFAFCRSPILNDHSGVVANCDNTSEWVHWVRACIGIAMRWVTVRISLLAFLLPSRKMQFSLLIIHIVPSRQIYGAIDNASLVPSVSCLTTMRYLWNTVRAADNISHAENLQSNGCQCFLTCTNFETGSKLPEFSRIVVSARSNQYSTKAPSSFWSFIFNSRCSFHGRRPFSAQ
jgi:hypothetical protein